MSSRLVTSSLVWSASFCLLCWLLTFGCTARALLFPRIVGWWKTKVPSRMLAGYKMDLQRIFNTKLPTALLNFGFKLRVKNVSTALRMRFVLYRIRLF